MSPRDGAGYAELRSYAAIGDGRTVALIAEDGQIDWLPLPAIDATPAFAAILDAEHGGFVSLQPDQPFTATRRYVDKTNVLITRFETATGSIEVTDALNTGVAGRLPWVELARRIDGLSGTVELTAVVAPGTCLNASSPWVHHAHSGAVLRLDGLSMAVRTIGAASLHNDDRRVTARFITGPGSRHLLGLVSTEREPLFLPDPADIDRGVDRTIANWQAWSEVFQWDGPWQDAVRRSALALKLLIYAPTGAIAAAATTSLPESRSGGKNWDYRFAWIRDSAYALTALFRFGLREETHGAISWLLATIREFGPEPEVFYTLAGSRPSGKSERDVPGWRGIGPVLTGNGAAEQLQLGVYGDLFAIVRLYVDNGNVLDADTGTMLASIADLACDRWLSKDAGMWELPDEQHYVSSKLGCWQALTAAAHLADLGQIPGTPARWRNEADRIRAWVAVNGWSAELGSYVWYPGSRQLDASILLHAISGFDRGPRMSATIDALRAELGHGPHLYRYTGMDKEEGTFVACSFWLVSALKLVGRGAEGEALMDQLVGSSNDVGLFAEQLDPVTGEFLGNLPQALSHLALINAAINLSSDDPEPV